MSNHNFTFGIIGLFFLLFGVFVLFQDPMSVPSGLATLDLEKDTFPANEFLNGKLTLALNQDDFINENAQIILDVKKEGNSVQSQSMSIVEFISRTGANLETTEVDGVKGYTANADFILDISWFGIIITESGAYELNAELKHNDTVYATTSKPVTIQSSEDQGLPTIYEVVFGVLDEDDLLDPEIEEFEKGDTLGCGVIYSDDVTKVKVHFYSPKDSIGSPTYSVENSSSNSEILASEDGRSAMLIHKEVKSSRDGEWSCTAEVFNDQGSVKDVAENTMILLDDDNDDDEDEEECDENWACTSWSTCVSGRQSRTCNDQNGCGTLLNKPEVTQTCTPPASNTNNQNVGAVSPGGNSLGEQFNAGTNQEETSTLDKIIVPAVILFIILVIIIIALIIIKKRKSDAIIEEEVKKPVEVQTKKPLTEIENYILKSLDSGVDKKTIKDNLLSKGWKPQQVDKTVNKIVLYKFAKESLGKGINKEVLKNSLIKKGWPQDLVNEVMQNV